MAVVTHGVGRAVPLLVAAAALAAGVLGPASATPDDLMPARMRYARHRTTLVLNCALCHRSADGGGKLNAYGEGYKRGGKRLAGFQAMDPLDTDGDGVVNVDELRADSHPTDPRDTPSPSDLFDVWAEDWPLELVGAAGFIQGLTRVTPTSRVLSDKAAGRVEAELRRELTPYERDCFFVLLRSKREGSSREELAGLVFPVTVAGPSGPMRIGVFMWPHRAVAGVLVVRHCEQPEPVEQRAPAAAEGEPVPGDEEQPSEDDSAPTAEQDQPAALGPPAFTRQEHLLGFAGWSLDNVDQWDDALERIIHGDPDHRNAYEAIAAAVRTALWLAEEVAPRATASSAVGVPKRERGAP